MSQPRQRPPSFKAVLFDLDGTLFSSLTDLGEAMNTVLTNQGFPPHPIDAYRYFVGDGMKKLVTRTLPAMAANDPNIVEACLAQMKFEYGQRWHCHSELYPGIPELLSRLEDRKMPLCILSNKPADLTEAIHRRFLSEWPFALIQGASAQFPLKPDPTAALAFAAELKIAPGAFLYLGDTAVDMATANSAGMYAIGCLWGFREAAELRGSGARILLNHPTELLDFLEGPSDIFTS